MVNNLLKNPTNRFCFSPEEIFYTTNLNNMLRYILTKVTGLNLQQQKIKKNTKFKMSKFTKNVEV